MADEANGPRRGAASHGGVPDLDVPSMRPSSPRGSALPPLSSKIPPGPRVPRAGSGMADLGDLGDDFGDMEIERGGAMSTPPMTSGRPSTTSGAPDRGRASGTGLGSGPPRSHASGAGPGAGSGLALRSSRPRPSFGPRERRGPSPLAAVVGGIVTIVSAAGAFVALVHFAHRPGRSLAAFLPHAFDASSPRQSGAFALTALALSVAIGYGGLKARGRSWAMVGSAAMLLIAALAMVTVTLVATDETPTPPDGARLVPYVMPLALVLFGLGVASRGLPYFHDGGSRRFLTVVVGLLGGALVFAGIELSALATLLP